ncbi:hypothetical protein EPO15_04775 [bacterium]|nr:MAG: hypothetical protein EPO15_04775 [bacterium]
MAASAAGSPGSPASSRTRACGCAIARSGLCGWTACPRKARPRWKRRWRREALRLGFAAPLARLGRPGRRPLRRGAAPLGGACGAVVAPRGASRALLRRARAALAVLARRRARRTSARGAPDRRLGAGPGALRAGQVGAPSRRLEPRVKSYDAVVAGSGAGGAAVAGRLAAGGMKVLLLERGGPARASRSAVSAVRRHYARGGLGAAFGDGLLPVPTGFGVGGTTAINSGTCLRTPADLVAGWERDVPGFSAAEFSSRLDEAWTALKVKQAPTETLSGSSRLVLAGFRRLGVLAEPLHRAEDGCTGEARCCFVCPSGAKMTSDKAFLDPLPSGTRPELWTRAELVGAASGRATVRRGREVETVAAGVTVLSCGALETPNLVRALRLGPEWRRAGDGLTLHPAAKLFGLFPQAVLPARGVPQGVGAVHPADHRIRLEGVATPPELTALTLPLEGARLKAWMAARARLATFGLMVKDEARGSVRAPFGRAWPLVRYAPTPGDLERLARGMRLAADALFAAGAERVLLPLNRRRNEARDAIESSALLSGGVTARELQGMAFHPLGTCGLGRVVGADLRLCPGVYVCDGSVVPESLGVNPQITIYAFALSLAARLLGGKG